MNTLQSTNWLQYGIKDIKHLKHANMHDPLIPFEPVFSPQRPTLLVAVRQSEVIRETPRHHHSCGQLIVPYVGYLRSMAVIVAGWYRQHMPSGYRQVFRTACARTVHIQDGVFMFLPKPVASYLISHLFSQ